MKEEVLIHEEALEHLGRFAYELAGEDSMLMFVMLLTMAEMVYKQALHNARSKGERKGTEGLSIQLRKLSREAATEMCEIIRARHNSNN